MTDPTKLPFREAAELRAAKAEEEALTATSALRSIAELLLLASEEERVNMANLSCLVTLATDRIEKPED